jgi:ribose 5-phosphate isomerase A
MRKIILASNNKGKIREFNESKLVDVMGAFPLPVEVIPMNANYVTREITSFCSNLPKKFR